MEGEIDDILPIGSLDGTESGYVRNETQRDEPKTVVESDIYREYASLCEPHEWTLFSGVKPSFDRTATDKRGKVPTIVVESDYEKDLNLPITFGSGVRPSFTRIAANQCVQEPKTVVESDIYREYASFYEPHEPTLLSGVRPSFDRTATDKHGKESKNVVESDYEKYPSLSGTRWSDEVRYQSAVKPSFAQTAAKKCAEESKNVVESDYEKYPSLSGTQWSEVETQSAVKPSFALTAAKKCAEVGDMILGQSVQSQKKITVRLYSEDLTKATVGDEEILEEEAVCNLCFAKLHSNDITIKIRCGCFSVLIHENCLDKWCKVIYDNKDNCDTCGKEVQKQLVILINDVIPVKIESSKRSWSSWFKRRMV